MSAGLLAVGVAAASYLKGAITAAEESRAAISGITVELQNQGEPLKAATANVNSFTEGIVKMSNYSASDARDALGVLTKKGMDAGTSLAWEGTIANTAAGAHISLADAANMVASAYNGKAKSLVTLGILNKQDALDLSKGIDVTQIMTKAQDGLNQRFGGTAAAAVAADGGIQQMKNQMALTQDQIGSAMLPVLDSLVKAIAPILTAISEFVSNNPQLTAMILGLVAVFATVKGGMGVINDVKGMLGMFVPALTPVAAAFAATAVAEDGVAVSTDAVGASMGIALLPILAIVAGVALLAFGVYELIKNWSSVSAFFTTLWADVKTIFTTSLDAITGVISTVWNAIASATAAVWNGIVSAVMAIVNFFVNGVTNTFNSMKAGLNEIMQGLKDIFGGVWDAIETIFLGAILLIIDLVTGNFGQMQKDAESIFNKLSKDFGTIWDGIKLVFTGALTAITGVLTLAWTGITTTATTAWTAIKTGVTTAFNAILDFFKTLPASLSALGAEAFNGLKSGITSVLSTLGGVVSSGFSSAISFIKALPSEALQWGKDIINGIVNGIKSAASAVGTAVQGVAQNIRSFLHFSVPDVGPLTDYQKWMPDMMAGLAQGITNSKGLVTKAISGLSSNMSVGLQVAASSLATSSPTLAGASSGGSVLITGNTFYVRNDQDITKVAQQLYKFQQSRKRGQGQ
jgi:phage-related protein